jgi:putative cardiolipin synthase
MYAKAVVADRHCCLVTSANLTGRALTDNVEIGVVLDNAVVAQGIAEHYERLRRAGWLFRFGS